jgi:hypothetical protein
MPKNKVSDPITDKEIAFARLVLSGAMTDRRAAETVGLNPDSAAYTKAKPRVRAYMLEHRAAVQQQFVQQEADLSRQSRRAAERAAEGMHRLNLDREQVLARLWEIANLSPEMTRGSITGQVKALSMIVAMQNLVPDRPTTSSEKKSPPAPIHPPPIYAAACPPRPAVGRDQKEDSPAVPACPGVPWKPESAPSSAAEAPPNPGPGYSASVNPFIYSQAPPAAPRVPVCGSVPDLRLGFSIKKNPFAPR